MPTLHAGRVRLSVAALALVLAAALAAYPALRADRATEVIAIAAAAGVVATGLTLATRVALLPLPLLLLAGTLELDHVLQPVPRPVLAVYAAALLVLGELVNWSLGLRGVALVDRAVVGGRAAALAAVSAGAAAVAAVALEASTLRLLGGLADAMLGVAAIVILVGVVAALLPRLPTTATERR